jgi:transposase
VRGRRFPCRPFATWGIGHRRPKPAICRLRRRLHEHPQVRFHFTPTYSSWLNQVELWFAKIQRDVIARGVFTSVADLGNKLRRYIRAYSNSATPFRWTYTDSTRRIRPNKIAGTAY